MYEKHKTKIDDFVGELFSGESPSTALDPRMPHVCVIISSVAHFSFTL